ncbi:hypothetical protein LCM10_14615 [Rossellomorea aquimaris]|nr:hypothetical protein [Rossellomorea aquimaris]MCA1056230.1 hypothetical protein [Rossellomorea aquimaris]
MKSDTLIVRIVIEFNGKKGVKIMFSMIMGLVLTSVIGLVIAAEVSVD